MTSATACKAVALVAAQNDGESFIIQFSGGEPLLNFSSIKAVVEYVESHKLNCQLQIQTNASLMTEEIAHYLYQHKVGIGVSLDGRPDVNDLLRLTKEGLGATSATLKGLAILQRLGIGCGLTCVVSSVNVKQLKGVVEMAYYLGNIRVLGFDLLRGQGRGNRLQPADKTDLEQALIEVWQCNEAMSKFLGYKIAFSQLEKAKNVYPFAHCHAMSGAAAFVDAVGKIYACASYVDDERFYLGNVDTGIDKLRIEQVHKVIAKSMEFCVSCQRFAECGGGCLARWHNDATQQIEPYEAECALKMFFYKKT